MSADGGRRVVAGAVSMRDISVVFGDGPGEVLAVDRVSLEVAAGTFVCLLGPSGCGKSTLLNVVAGFETPRRGAVAVDGEPVRGPGPDRGMVFQQPALFPWKTVAGNVSHGPRMAGASNREALAIARDLLAMVGLSASAGRYPHMLSGGMQQRVAIARALANSPGVLLMDEPFGALDAQTRLIMQESLMAVWGELGATVIFVTHDIDEAVFIADRIVVMSAGPGRIVEDLVVDLPRPRTPELSLDARFLAIKRRCMQSIRAETLRAFAHQHPT